MILKPNDYVVAVEDYKDLKKDHSYTIAKSWKSHEEWFVELKGYNFSKRTFKAKRFRKVYC